MKETTRNAAQKILTFEGELQIREIQGAGEGIRTSGKYTDAAEIIAVMAKEAPSLKCVGLTVHPGVNGGHPVPRYEMREETPERWNAEASRANREAYIQFTGHEPESNREMYEYLYKMAGIKLPSPLPEWAK